MQISIDEIAYAPTFFLRVAELQALEHLSDGEKDDLIPIFLLKPWSSANHLEAATRRIRKIFPTRNFILDLDRYFNRPSDRPAWHEFRSLFDSNEGYRRWRDFLDGVPEAIPCLQLHHSAEALQEQIAWANEGQRTFAVRVDRGFDVLADTVIPPLSRVDHNNYLIIIDASWGRDLLFQEFWASTWISRFLEINQQARIIVTGSSFPQDFMSYGTYGEEPYQERPLFAALQQRHNEARLMYGDWASVRPHGTEGGGPGYPRIDLPLANRWVFFRGSSINGDFRPLAFRAVESAVWDGDMTVWGKYFIQNTADNVGSTINSAQQAAAARVNIHLTEQIRLAFPAAAAIEQDFVD